MDQPPTPLPTPPLCPHPFPILQFPQVSQRLTDTCRDFLLRQLSAADGAALTASLRTPVVRALAPAAGEPQLWGSEPFYIAVQPGDRPPAARFDFDAPTTRRNCVRVLRGMQVGAGAVPFSGWGCRCSALRFLLARCMNPVNFSRGR